MKKSSIQILLGVFLFLMGSLSNNTNGQVTIGANLRPNSGSLLDIKQNNNVNENSTKGLGLPRVNLTQRNSLDDLVVGLDKNEHIGLVVYHAGIIDPCANKPIANGIYVWNGSEWVNISFASRLDDASTNIITTSKSGLEQPNTYMVHQPSTVKIPVEKAFTVWDGVSWKDENNNALLDAKNFTGKKMSVSLLWQDGRCENKPVEEISISNSNSDPSAYINVITTGGYGNAVIALHIGDNGNNTDEIVWSWHIWGTPEMNEPVYNNLTWMDRNLGATTTDSDDGRSNGNYYQWGRKDPFYGSHNWNLSAPVITDMDGNVVQMAFSGGVNTDKKVNLSNTITKPFTYMTSLSANDWYSDTGFLWQTRWGADGTKSVSDPCPEGWKVPIGTGGTGIYHTVSPWDGLSDSNFILVGNYGKVHDVLGFYPLSGHRTFSGGNISNMQSEGSAWSGTPVSSSQPNIRYLSNYTSSVSTWYTRYNAMYGFPIRCVRE